MVNLQLEQDLASYEPSAETVDLVKDTEILFLVGPTGAGKDSIKDILLKDSEHYHHIISHTTRPPRINHGVKEQNGVEYHFIDVPSAQHMLAEKAFVEAKFFSGHVYATSAAEIAYAKADDKVAITDLEVKGAAEYKNIDPAIMAVFLLPPDFKTWQKRLQKRYGDVVDVADMQRRMETALNEIEQLLNTNYYFAVINDNLINTVEEIKAITRTHKHDSQLEQKARQCAQDLALEIQNYLADS